MPLQSPALGKAILKQLRERGFVFGKRHQAIANVAGRKHVKFAAQAARTSSVVGDRHHGRDLYFARLRGIAFQAVQQRRKTGSSTDGDYAERLSPWSRPLYHPLLASQV